MIFVISLILLPLIYFSIYLLDMFIRKMANGTKIRFFFFCLTTLSCLYIYVALKHGDGFDLLNYTLFLLGTITYIRLRSYDGIFIALVLATSISLFDSLNRVSGYPDSEHTLWEMGSLGAHWFCVCFVIFARNLDLGWKKRFVLFLSVVLLIHYPIIVFPGSLARQKVAKHLVVADKRVFVATKFTDGKIFGIVHRSQKHDVEDYKAILFVRNGEKYYFSHENWILGTNSGSMDSQYPNVPFLKLLFLMN